MNKLSIHLGLGGQHLVTQLLQVGGEFFVALLELAILDNGLLLVLQAPFSQLGVALGQGLLHFLLGVDFILILIARKVVVLLKF